MKSYTISNGPMHDAVPEAMIDTYLWENNGYTPRSSARLSLMGDTLFLRMRAEESNPLIRYYRGDPEPRVWCDSCLEIYISPNDAPIYVNLEMNGAGSFLCLAGTERHGRVACDIFAEEGQPVAKVCDGYWQLDTALSLRKLAAICGVETVTSLRGNFYKCGDETALPHFGMWAEVGVSTPDFHRPEYFCPFLLPTQA